MSDTQPKGTYTPGRNRGRTRGGQRPAGENGQRRRRRRPPPEARRAIRTVFGDAFRSFVPGRKVTRSEAGITTNADHRREQLARMGTFAWFRFRVARFRARNASEEKRQEIFEKAMVRTAQDAYEVIGNMKGAMMKLAQFASFEPGVPESARDQLKQLQAAAPPMTPELAAQCIEKELGATPDKVFKRFDMEPIASASIGQVHKARTKDGRDVAVKVQYPGVDEAISADLGNAGMFIKTMSAAMQQDADFSAHLEEVAARVGEELDYVKEAANQQWFADHYRGHPFVKVPDVVADLSRQHVLTSEFVEGRGFYDTLQDSQEARNRLGEIIFRFAFTSVFGDGVFSGDPHPGNYIFMDDGRVCFLDFGLVKRVDAQERAMLRGPMAAMLEGDPDKLRSSLVELGVLKPDADFPTDLLWQVFVALLGPVAEDKVVRCSIERTNEEFRDIGGDIEKMDRSERMKLMQQLDMPPVVIFFQRYRRGTWAILAHLQAEANWHRILKEILFGDPPSTEMGKAWSSAASHA